MSGHHHEQHIPRPVLIGAGLLMLLTIAIAGFARSARGNDDETRVEPPQASVTLRFEDRPDGSIGVLDAATSREVMVVPPESDGFIRGVLRGLFRTRKLESIARDEPFRLAREADGRFVLEDLASGHRVELRSFGRTNYDAFSRLLASAPAPDAADLHRSEVPR